MIKDKNILIFSDDDDPNLHWRDRVTVETVRRREERGRERREERRRDDESSWVACQRVADQSSGRS